MNEPFAKARDEMIEEVKSLLDVSKSDADLLLRYYRSANFRHTLGILYWG